MNIHMGNHDELTIGNGYVDINIDTSKLLAEMDEEDILLYIAENVDSDKILGGVPDSDILQYVKENIPESKVRECLGE